MNVHQLVVPLFIVKIAGPGSLGAPQCMRLIEHVQHSVTEGTLCAPRIRISRGMHDLRSKRPMLLELFSETLHSQHIPELWCLAQITCSLQRHPLATRTARPQDRRADPNTGPRDIYNELYCGSANRHSGCPLWSSHGPILAAGPSCTCRPDQPHGAPLESLRPAVAHGCVQAALE